ncbi:MAG TPA: hypothetical protein VEY10_02250 [Flavisolibacter sp.]|jgi:hypothetical protein|nr:hypothetical protein [Flavisolibacter sp.]
MKWVLSHQSYDHRKWMLQDTNEPAQLTYNLAHHSIRIRSKNIRLFFLEVSGFIQKKIQLLSEYGVVIGESRWGHTLNEGMLTMNNNKYFFEWENNVLSLFDKNKSLLSAVKNEHSEGMDKKERFALVFSLAWIVISNTPAKKIEDLLVA